MIEQAPADTGPERLKCPQGVSRKDSPLEELHESSWEHELEQLFGKLWKFLRELKLELALDLLLLVLGICLRDMNREFKETCAPPPAHACILPNSQNWKQPVSTDG